MSLAYLERFFHGIGQTEALIQSRARGATSKLQQVEAIAKSTMYGLQFAAYRRLGKPSWWMKKFIRRSYYRGLLGLPLKSTAPVASTDRRAERAAA